MKQRAALLVMGLLVAGTALFAQESKPRTYTLVMQGAV
jgi:hypothetical protein